MNTTLLAPQVDSFQVEGISSGTTPCLPFPEFHVVESQAGAAAWDNFMACASTANGSIVAHSTTLPQACVSVPMDSRMDSLYTLQAIESSTTTSPSHTSHPATDGQLSGEWIAQAPAGLSLAETPQASVCAVPYTYVLQPVITTTPSGQLTSMYHTPVPQAVSYQPVWPGSLTGMPPCAPESYQSFTLQATPVTSKPPTPQPRADTPPMCSAGRRSPPTTPTRSNSEAPSFVCRGWRYPEGLNRKARRRILLQVDGPETQPTAVFVGEDVLDGVIPKEE